MTVPLLLMMPGMPLDPGRYSRGKYSGYSGGGGDDDDFWVDFWFIVGLSVGIPLVLVALIIAVIAICA